MGTNRNHKDSVFVSYFKDKKHLLDAYNAIDNKSYPLDTEIEINTLEDVLYHDRINDISFTLEGKLIVFIEHQSTINENMPLRLLIYISKVYELFIGDKEIYQRKLIKLPKPEFIVLYNGNYPHPDKETLCLSTAFMDVYSPDTLELTVRVYNINKGHNSAMLARSKALNDYSTFVSIVKENENMGLTLEKSIENAVEYCIRNEVMPDFLKVHRREVKNMLFVTDWNLDIALAAERKEGVAEGLALGEKRGEARGIEQGKLSIAKNLKAQNIPVEVIATSTGLSPDEIKSL
jgi:predicted transposase/invertase (TIGR01784 family)